MKRGLIITPVSDLKQYKRNVESDREQSGKSHGHCVSVLIDYLTKDQMITSEYLLEQLKQTVHI